MSALQNALGRERWPEPADAVRWLVRIGLAFGIFVAVDIHIAQGVGDYLSDFMNPGPQEKVLRPLVFKLVFSLGVFAMFISRSPGVRILGTTITFLCFWLYISYEALNTTGQGFNSWLGFEVADANTILIEISRPGATGDAFSAFLPMIVKSGALAFFYASVLAAVAHWIAPRVGSAWMSLAPIIGLSILYVATANSGASINHFPIAAKVPFQFYEAASMPIYRGERDPVEIASDAARRQELLIYVVDESIRGDVLGVNGFEFDTTPFLSSIEDRLLNYGVASSMTNASAGSNILLQTGLGLEDINESTGTSVYKVPNIFQYARAAGYATVYIDGQLKGARLQNYMRGTDFDFIDRYHQIRSEFPEIERWNIDHRIATLIGEISRERLGEPIFFYVVKSGVHFPYGGSYPPDAKSPTLAPGSGIDLEAMAADEVGEIRLGYYTAVRWAVDRFFRKLIPEIEGHDGTVVYTADHGQALREDGALATHATIIATLPQGLVPLWLIPFGESRASVEALARPNLAKNEGRASHFALYSTVLVLAGYDRDTVRSRYGPSLFDELTGSRTFLSGFYPGSPGAIHNDVPEWTGVGDGPPPEGLPTARL